MKNIKGIVAIDKNGLIGNNNEIPWHIPEDLKWFKENTLNQICVMGRKTYESLPITLKNREVYVFTRDKKYEYPNLIHWTPDLISLASKTEKDVWLCGGSEIYNLNMIFCSEFYVTIVEGEYEGDSFLDLKKFNNMFELDCLIKEYEGKCKIYKYKNRLLRK